MKPSKRNQANAARKAEKKAAGKPALSKYGRKRQPVAKEKSRSE